MTERRSSDDRLRGRELRSPRGRAGSSSSHSERQIGDSNSWTVARSGFGFRPVGFQRMLFSCTRSMQYLGLPSGRLKRRVEHLLQSGRQGDARMCRREVDTRGADLQNACWSGKWIASPPVATSSSDPSAPGETDGAENANRAPLRVRSCPWFAERQPSCPANRRGRRRSSRRRRCGRMCSTWQWSTATICVGRSTEPRHAPRRVCRRPPAGVRRSAVLQAESLPPNREPPGRAGETAPPAKQRRSVRTSSGKLQVEPQRLVQPSCGRR
jgi:hypothetical protein